MDNTTERKIWEAVNGAVYDAVTIGELGAEYKRECLKKVEGMLTIISIVTGEELETLRAKARAMVANHERMQREFA